MDHNTLASGGWLLFAIIAVFVAGTKNRSGFNWFFLTMIFGPIALFILVFLCDTVKKR